MGTVLAVDDARTIRALVEFTLTEAGHKVILADTGFAALTALQELERSHGSVDMIITDVHMPEMDGLTFIRYVKQSQFKDVPIIVLTTEAQGSMKDKGRELGATGWLIKPFKREQLLELVERFVGKPSRFRSIGNRPQAT